MKVFISFVTEDKGPAERVFDALRSQDIRASICTKGITEGQEFRKVIEDALESATHFLLIYSRHVAERPDNVLDEFSFCMALRPRPKLLVIRIDQAEYARGLRLGSHRWQYVTADRDMSGDALQRIVAAVRTHTDTEELKRSTKPPLLDDNMWVFLLLAGITMLVLHARYGDHSTVHRDDEPTTQAVVAATSPR